MSPCKDALSFKAYCEHAGQSNPPNHLSMFLEVTDSKAGSSEWSCFVSHRLSVVNQKFEGDRYIHGTVLCLHENYQECRCCALHMVFSVHMDLLHSSVSQLNQPLHGLS